MAHIVASDYCYFATAFISAAKVRQTLQTQVAQNTFLHCRENGGQQVMFSGIFMSYTIKEFALSRNKVDYW